MMYLQVSIPTGLLVLVVMGTGVVGQVIPRRVGLWPLNAEHLANDISGGGNHGQAVGTTLAEGPDGEPQSAFSFAGNLQSYVEIPNNGELDVRRSFTILLFLYHIGGRSMLDYRRPGQPGTLFWLNSNNQLYVDIQAPDPHGFHSSIQLPQEQWMFLGVTYDYTSGEAQLWKDGVNIGTRNFGPLEHSTTNPIRLAVSAGHPIPINGRMSCLQIYNYPLSQQEIQNARNACSESGCPSGYIPYGDWCYKNYNGNKPWSEARQVCADDGGLLAMPKDSGVHNFLKNNLADINHYYWIGMSDLATEGAWMWEDGTPHDTTADFNVWNSGEPNSAGDEDCVHYEPNLTGWNDQGCSSGFSFICQVRLGTDHCDPNPCQNGGVCTTSGDSYNCECADGWEGPNCDTDVDECADDSDNCHEQATCANTDGGFTCACNSGYSGDGVTCTDVDECADGSHNCHEQATCTNTDGGFTCACNSGYNGDGVTCTGLSDLTFTDVEMDYMSLSWTAPAGVSRYRLRYSHAGASYQDLSPPPAPSDTTATVAGLLADTEYTFTLTAFGADGEEIGEITGTETTAEVIVNVECYEDYMTVTFPRGLLEASGVTLDLHLLDDSCRSTVTDQLVTLVAPLQSCGTIQDSSEDDKFVFTNEAIGSQETADNGAVRGTPFSKRFQCEFVRQYVVSQGRQIMYNIPLPRVQVVDGETSFTFEMHMYTSSDFTATYESPDFPLQVTSSDHLNFGLSVKSPLNNLQLFALHCLATPTTDPAATPSVSIIQDGCDIDPTLQLDSTLSNDMALYYSIQSFTFPNIDDPSLVYIHCTMVVCFKDDTASRCSEGCVPAARRRRAVSDKSEARVRRASENDHQADIMQGPFAVKGEQNQASTVPTVGIAVGTVAGIAGALLVVFAVLLVRKRRGRDAKEQAEDRVGFDNYSLELWGKDKAANGTPKPE